MASFWSIFLGVGQLLAGAFLLATGAGGGLGFKLLLSGGLSLISSFLPRKSGGEGWRSSPTYGFDNLQNVTQEGGVVPVVYGRHRVAPPIISANVIPDGEEQALWLQLLVSEGEIDSIADVEINDLPLSSFPRSFRIVKRGTASQTAAWFKGGGDDGVGGDIAVKGFDQIGRPYQAGTRLAAGSSHTYAVKDATDSLSLNLVWQGGLYKQEDDGSTESQQTQVNVQWKRTGEPDSSFQPFLVPLDSVTGKRSQGPWYGGSTAGTWYTKGETRSSLRRQIRLDFPSSGLYTVKVTGEVDDDATHIRTPTIASVIELSNDSRAYANRALLGLRIVATEQIAGGIPRVTCTVKGRKLYDPRNGTTAWSQNPVLVARDILLNTRYGAGHYFTSADLDEGVGGTWRAMADKCDADVASRGGVSEDRFHCDLVLDQKSEVADWLTQVLGSARMSLHDSEGLIKVTIDDSDSVDRSFEARASVPVSTTRHNVLRRDDGTSSIEVRELGESERFNVLRARFTDETDKWRQRVLELVNRSVAVGTITGTPTVGEDVVGATSKAVGRFLYADAGVVYFAKDEGVAEFSSGEALSFRTSGASCSTTAAELTRPAVERVHEIQLYGVTRPTEAMRAMRYALNVVSMATVYAAWGHTLADIELEPGDLVDISEDVMSYAGQKFRVLDVGRDALGAMRLALREYDPAVYTDTIDAIPAAARFSQPGGTAPPTDRGDGSKPPATTPPPTTPPASTPPPAQAPPTGDGFGGSAKSPTKGAAKNKFPNANTKNSRQ